MEPADGVCEPMRLAGELGLMGYELNSCSASRLDVRFVRSCVLVVVIVEQNLFVMKQEAVQRRAMEKTTSQSERKPGVRRPGRGLIDVNHAQSATATPSGNRDPGQVGGTMTQHHGQDLDNATSVFDAWSQSAGILFLGVDKSM